MDLKRHSNYYVFIDLETSGADPDKFGVISCAMIITDNNLNIIDSFERLVKPPMLSKYTWSTEAEQFHKIPFEKVFNNGISNDQFCYEFLCFLAKYRPATGYLPFICHASKNGMRKLSPLLFDEKTKKPLKRKDLGTYEIWPKFDYSFMERAMRRANFNDGLEMVWQFWKLFHPEESFISTVNMGREAGYKTNRLPEWAERLRFILNHHDAMSDTLCCLEIFKKLRFYESQNTGAVIDEDEKAELETFFGYEGNE